METIKRYTAIALLGIFVILCLAPNLPAQQKVNINSATKTELVTLKYVGEKLADRIISYRKKTPFKSIEDLLKVKGIGPKILKANKDKITL